MLVTTNVRVPLIEDSGAPVNAGFRDGGIVQPAVVLPPA